MEHGKLELCLAIGPAMGVGAGSRIKVTRRRIIWVPRFT